MLQGVATDAMSKTIAKLGFYAGLVAFVATMGFNVAQSLQLVRVFTFPLDAILIYGFSLLIPVPFTLAMLALHYSVSEDRRFWTHAALLFTVPYATYVLLNYVVQLATVIPATLQGMADQIRLLDQTPHSLFWNVDALGYISMGLATLFAAPAFTRHRLGLWTRGFFIAHAAMTPVISFVYFYPRFSEALLMIAAPWMVTGAGVMLLLALYLRGEPTVSEPNPLPPLPAGGRSRRGQQG